MGNSQVTVAPSEDIVLSARNLTKIYPGAPRPAVHDLTLSIATGEAFALLGPNGAGKTTAISMMSTLMKPTSGTLTLCGIDAVQRPYSVKRMIGYVPQEVALYPVMSARENLRFIGRVYGLKGKVLEERIDACMEFVGLRDSADQRVATYSGGMKRRANLAAGILHRPQVLFLDEPTVGIDPQSRNYILERLAAMNENTALVYTTHYIGEVEQLCSRIAIMDQGRIIAMGTLKEIFDRAPESMNLEEVFISLTGRQLRD
jgi:ABC-2 type transport system ATP-binding protein